jgi:hypothetical protein
VTGLRKWLIEDGFVFDQQQIAEFRRELKQMTADAELRNAAAKVAAARAAAQARWGRSRPRGRRRHK